ncbi:T-cell receptor alpha chain V region HPB-MLT [Acipenser ruthenus]|nr:T-cell receptor alpha chain V region HPB-MLT [Acipenser ruthenus]
MEESEKQVQEGGDVHITFKYTTSYSSYDLYWYRHDEANPPLFLIRRDSVNNAEWRADGLDTCFSMELKTRETLTTLTITGSQLKDSSTYYCALSDSQCCILLSYSAKTISDCKYNTTLCCNIAH